MKMENQFWFLEYNDGNLQAEEDFIDYMERTLHYDNNQDKWVMKKEYTGYWYPGTFPCHSYRAALRHLRNHDEIPKGSVFRLVSKWVGKDRYLIKK